MNIESLVLKLLPLYLLILLGVAAAKIKISRDSIAKLLLYLISPGLCLLGSVKLPATTNFIFMPLTVFCLCSLIAMLVYNAARILKSDLNHGLQALLISTGNTGYFGLPVVAAVFGEKALVYAVVANLGVVIFEMTLGYYLVACSVSGKKVAMKRILRLPAIYCILAGLLLRECGYADAALIAELFNYCKYTYSLLGMMLIGMGLASLKINFKLLRQICTVIAVRFCLWPLTVLLLIYADSLTFRLFSGIPAQILFVFSIVPVAANTIVIASDLKAEPEFASSVVFASTLAAVFLIPFILSAVLPFIR